MNVMVFITLHATNNMVNIVQMLAIIVLSVIFEFDYHLQKLDVGALWRMTYVVATLVSAL